MSVVACWGGADAPFQFTGRQPIARDDSDPTMASYTSGHLGFHGWLRAVDRAIGRRIGIGVFDLPDRRWREAYDDRVLPRDAALEALAEEGCPLD